MSDMLFGRRSSPSDFYSQHVMNSVEGRFKLLRRDSDGSDFRVRLFSMFEMVSSMREIGSEPASIDLFINTIHDKYPTQYADALVTFLKFLPPPQKQ
ncbi:hypothetical protein [Caulobacter sp. S45]|uniref:hypothetical protein n=1 Tax=Caulobacter sp. S45 TaxID=1641861 RepID=UPI0015765489|nr:hypothetical protein [Caulobacter sp. S45]